MGDDDGVERHLLVATASPDASDTAWYYLGVQRMRVGRFEEAEPAFRQALLLNPSLFEAAHDLGRTLHEEGRFQDAIEQYERAMALRPTAFEPLHNAGRSKAALERYDEALALYDRSLRINPEQAETWLNRGEVLHDIGDFDAALESYVRALRLRPDFPEATANSAVTLLARGDYERGWTAFEARRRGASSLAERHTGIASWSAEQSLDGKTLLVWAEQGFGDTLQFCRYLPLLIERGASLVLEVQQDLKALMAANFDFPVIAAGEPAPACDLQVSLVSLPLAFKTRLDTIPAVVPYLRPVREKVERWRTRLNDGTKGVKVAVATSGRKSYKHEARRRVAVCDLHLLAQHADLYLVQKDLSPEDREYLRANGNIRYLGDEITDFTDGSAIVENMDLVITIDTSLGHLAGALAKPVWLLLSDVPDWRWMLERCDSPWYPTARLFRQRRAGSWDDVLGDVLQALREFSSARACTATV
jgi:Flp pilus assembly protein TadD